MISSSTARSRRSSAKPSSRVETRRWSCCWCGPVRSRFGFRPLGAILFGFLGDRLGRKYTFLVTVTLMGIATAGVGMIPSAATIGIAAPIIVIAFRILQGLALGGDMAAQRSTSRSTHRREARLLHQLHPGQRGRRLCALDRRCRGLPRHIPEDDFAAWGWRVPFLLSILLLVISLWMRMKLSESPVFQAIKDAGETAGNPSSRASPTPATRSVSRGPVRVAGTLTGSGTPLLLGLSFLRGPMRMDEGLTEVVVLIAGLIR